MNAKPSTCRLWQAAQNAWKILHILPLKDGLVESEEIVKEVIDVFAQLLWKPADPDEETPPG